MASIDEQCEIVLGPGNEVTNVPQNERLLELIQQATVWQTEKVLRLSQILQKYPGNAPLGRHVALTALTMQAGPQAAPAGLAPYIDWEEIGEVFGEPDDESKESNQTFYRRVPWNGIGLLVETYVSTDEKQVQTTRHFVIGVAPAL